MYSPKSASTAGLLGIFLGAFGAHDWYLGNRQKHARLHLFATIASVALFAAVIIIRTVASSGQSPDAVSLLNNVATVLYVAAWLVLLSNIVWGIVEGVLLLAQGDAGLKARGYYIKNDPDNPLARSLSTTTVHERSHNVATQTPTTQGATAVATATRLTISLPNAPTLEQQGSNIDSRPQPVIFRSSDIHQSFQFENVFDATAQPTPTPQPISGVQSAAVSTSESSPVVNSNSSYMTPSNPVGPATTATPTGPASVSTPAPTPLPNRPATPTQAFGTKTVKDLVTKVQRKVPFNPVVTRRIIISVAVALFVIIAGFIIKGVLESTVTTGYGATYRAARDLSAKLSSLGQTPYCQYVSDYANDASVAMATYERYLTGCRETLTEVAPLVDQLGESPALGWNPNLAANFQEFKSLYDDNFPATDQAAIMSERLGLYQTWHAFLIAADQLNGASPDLAITQAADLLRNSGDEALAQYGNDWLARELDYVTAYRRYEEAETGSHTKDDLRREMEQKRTEFQAWVSEHLPNLVTTAPVASPDVQLLARNFASFYERIKRAYAQNYDHNSGDCDDRSGTVYCQ